MTHVAMGNIHLNHRSSVKWSSYVSHFYDFLYWELGKVRTVADLSLPPSPLLTLICFISTGLPSLMVFFRTKTSKYISLNSKSTIRLLNLLEKIKA